MQAQHSKGPPIAIENLFSGIPATPDQASFRQLFLHLFETEEDFLPSARKPLGRLWALIQSSHSTLEECATVIQLDPALAARLFRVANSAACKGNASTIQGAVFHLGLAKLRQFVFTNQIFDRFSRLSLPLAWEAFWVRNVFVAQLTERVASFYFQPDGTEYLAGMLHDTGWLLLDSYFPVEFDVIIENSMPLDGTEAEILSFTHADVSAAVCVKSHIPLRAIEAVRRHHTPALPPIRDVKPAESAAFLSVLLFLCDRMADTHSLCVGGKGTGDTYERLVQRPEFTWLTGFGKTPDFKALAEEELTRVYSLCDSLLQK